MQKSIFWIATLFLFTALIFSPLTTSAHLEDGEDKIVGNYLIDFGYSPAHPQINQGVTIALNLVDNTTKKIIVPDHVWVRIAADDQIIFAGALFPEAQHINFLQTFPTAGSYEVTTRFYDKNQLMTEASFPLRIVSSSIIVPPVENKNGWSPWLCAATVVGISLTSFMVGRWKNKKSAA